MANPETIPAVLSWLRYLSPCYYAYLSNFQNEFTGLAFVCADGQAPVNGVCTPGFATGEQVIEFYQLGYPSLTAAALIIFGFGVAFHIMAYVALYFKSKPKMKLI